SKVVWASAAGAAAAPPPPAGAAAMTGAAALTPQADSSFFTRSAASMTVNLLNESTIVAISAILPFSFVVRRGHGGFEFTACEPTIYYVYVCLLPSGWPAGRESQCSVFGVRCSVF